MSDEAIRDQAPRHVSPKHPARKTVGFQLMLAARLYRTRMAILLAEIGVFPGQDQVLQALAMDNGKAADGMIMGDLARALRVRPPTASKTIARLAAQGLVERRVSLDDGRVVRVHLTEAGRSKLAAIEQASASVEAELEEALGNKEGRRLRKSLRRMSRALAGTGQSDDPAFGLGDNADDDEGDSDFPA